MHPRASWSCRKGVQGCTAESLELPEDDDDGTSGLETIAEACFQGCTSLKVVFVPPPPSSVDIDDGCYHFYRRVNSTAFDKGTELLFGGCKGQPRVRCVMEVTTEERLDCVHTAWRNCLAAVVKTWQRQRQTR